MTGRLGALQRTAEREGRLDWTTHFVDGTVVRAHQHAAGAVGGQQHEALGRSRSGFSTKVHVRAEGGGRPIALVVSGGECHETRYVEALLVHPERSDGDDDPRVLARGSGRPTARDVRRVHPEDGAAA